MMRRVIRSWKEIEVGMTVYFRSTLFGIVKTFKYEVLEKDWQNRRILVRSVMPGKKRPPKPVYIMNVPRWIDRDAFRRIP